MVQACGHTWPTKRARRLHFASLLQMIMGLAMIGIAVGALGFGLELTFGRSGLIADAQDSLKTCYTLDELPPVDEATAAEG